MKKLLIVLVAIIFPATLLNAQNSTKMASEHKWTYGASLSVSDRDTYHFGALSFERNSELTNYRTRISLGWLERTHFCPSAAVDAQYLIGILNTGIYIYPSVGVYAETFHKVANMGVQAAAGAEFQLGHRIGIFAEGRYSYLVLNGGAQRLSATAGLKFAFGSKDKAKQKDLEQQQKARK